MRDDREIRRAVEKLVSQLRGVKAVILFGSRARGDWGPWSDVDLLVIADFEERYLDRLSRILELLSDVKLPIEPHPYTLEEAAAMLRKGNPLLVDALEEGVVLFSTSELEELRGLLDEMKKRGMKRTSTSIVLPPEEP
jgi:predicted nucleotidyltransferase